MTGIKNRFWSTIRQEFITDCDVYLVNGKVLAGDLDNPPIVDITDNVIINAFTGLLDGNDKEIYDGDILKFDHLEGYAGQLQIVSMSKWSWGTDEYSFYEMVDRNYNFEVIGNIYENPELLSEVNE